MNKKTIKDIDLKGKKVLVRCDFNVPMDEEKNITDNTRIVAALPTIKYLLENNCAVILCSHLGRPKGEFKAEFSLKPVAKELSNLLNTEVIMANDVIGEDAKTKAKATKYIFDAVKDKGLQAVVVYPSGVIGPCDYKVSELGQVLLDYINGKMAGYIQGGYNFVDVRDVADGIINAATNGRIDEGYNLTGEVVSIKQMFQSINLCLHKNYLPPKVPLWIVKIFTKVSTFHYRRLGKKPILSDYSIYTLNVNSNFSNEKAKTELNFKNRDYKQSLCDALKWFVKNKPELVSSRIIKKLQKHQVA